MQNSLNVLQESQSLQTATDGTDRKKCAFLNNSAAGNITGKCQHRSWAEEPTIIVVLCTLVAYKEFISHSQHEDFFGHWHMLTDLVSCNKGGWISAKQI